MIVIMRSIAAKHEKPGVAPAVDRSVAIVVYDGLSLFEFAAAAQVFGGELAATVGRPWYRTAVCATEIGPVRVDRGFDLLAPHDLRPVARAGTVVVPPTDCPDEVPEAVLAAIRRAHRRGARVLSLCTGALVLARAGLLDGRRATTHWAHCDELRQKYPRVDVNADVLYVDDGDLLTSAGSAASIDLCLHIVRKDFGAEVASRVARQLVVPPHREGGQAQYIEKPLPPAEECDLFAETLTWLQEHLDEPLTIDDLAARAAMSKRTFARRFGETVGTTPYQWLLRQRIGLAQRLLETTDLGVESVAERSGFVTAANLRKHFQRLLRTNPQSYRRTFAAD